MCGLSLKPFTENTIGVELRHRRYVREFNTYPVSLGIIAIGR